MVNSHLCSNGKNLRVYTYIHLTEQLLTHTLTKFCITLISNKTVTTRFSLFLRIVLLLLTPHIVDKSSDFISKLICTIFSQENNISFMINVSTTLLS